MSVDLYRDFPRPGTARRADRATTLDAPVAGRAPSRKSDLLSTVAKVDPGQVASLVSTIVETVDGQNLAAIVPVVAGLLNEMLGISPTGDFRDAISTALYTLVGPDGRTVNPPQVERQPHQRSLTAGALGVSPHTTVTRTTPRARAGP